ncbi:MAG: GatB/YqeY domain-containing protein [Anaerolineales bacterium]|nr:GatB/YqeY domain-containing protein [Anaerolineales bacterium]
MTLKATLENDMREALRAKDEMRKNTLRLALSSIRLVEIDKTSPLDEAGVMAVLQKEIKSRHELIADAEKANRPDLIEAAQKEIAILADYLPEALSEEELETIARQVIADTGATSPAQLGQVMKILMPQLKGRATGDQASQAVRKLLQG